MTTNLLTEGSYGAFTDYDDQRCVYDTLCMHSVFILTLFMVYFTGWRIWSCDIIDKSSQTTRLQSTRT